MAKLIDRLATCVAGMERCQKAFYRPQWADRLADLVCGNCHNDGKNMLDLYLDGQVGIAALKSGLRVPRSWMMSRNNGWVDAFARHISVIDDGELIDWWQSNTRGPASLSAMLFIELVIKRHGELVFVRGPQAGLTQKINVQTPPPQVARPAPKVAEPINPPKVAESQAAVAAVSENKVTLPLRQAEPTSKKRSRKSDAGKPHSVNEGVVASMKDVEAEAEAEVSKALDQASEIVKDERGSN